jgi:hypothetical protein
MHDRDSPSTGGDPYIATRGLPPGTRGPFTPALRLAPGNAPGTIVIEQFALEDASGAKVALPALAP